MDAKEHEGSTGRARDDRALDELLLAPAAILEGLPDAVGGRRRATAASCSSTRTQRRCSDTRTSELLGQPVQMLWPERVRDRYTRNMQLYFATEHPLRFSTAPTGLRRDGSEFVGEMSWGIVETEGGPLLLAIGRDMIGTGDARRGQRLACRWRRWASARWRAPTSADLAAEAVELMRETLPLAGAEVRVSALGDRVVRDLSSTRRAGADRPAGRGVRHDRAGARPTMRSASCARVANVARRRRWRGCARRADAPRGAARPAYRAREPRAAAATG